MPDANAKPWDTELVKTLRFKAQDDEYPGDQEAFIQAAAEIERLGRKVQELASLAAQRIPPDVDYAAFMSELRAEKERDVRHLRMRYGPLLEAARLALEVFGGEVVSERLDDAEAARLEAILHLTAAVEGARGDAISRATRAMREMHERARRDPDSVVRDTLEGEASHA